jgi:hypothetical protein
MPPVLLLTSDTVTTTESVSLAFNPGFPVIFEPISITESVSIARSILEINVVDTVPILEVVTPFSIDLQDTQGGGGGGGVGVGSEAELWRPTWLIDMSQMTVIPGGYAASSLRFSTQDIDALSPPYNGRLVRDPTIDRRLMNVFWGITEIADVTFSLSNADGLLTALFTGGDIREQPITITRYDLASGIIAEEYHARISSIGLVDGTIVITASSPALTLFEQLVPSKLIDKTTYPKAVSVDVPIPVIFGNVSQAPLPYICDDTLINQYVYVVGYGVIDVSAVYRDGPNETLVTITTAEYSVSTTLYPGMTVVVFPIRQINFFGGFHLIFADVLAPSRSFVNAIQQVITDTTWGLGQQIDAGTFATAEQDLLDFSGMFCDGVVGAQAQAQDLLRLLMIVRGMRLGFNNANQWTLVVDKVPPSIKMRMRDGTGDGERNIQQAGQRQLVHTTDAISLYKIKYRLNFPKGGTSAAFDFTQSRIVNGFGKETVLEHPFIRDHETADRVCDYLAKREKFSQDSCDFEITQEARQIREGDLVEVTYVPNGYSGTLVEVREIEKKTEGNHVVVSGWDASIFVYQPGTLPTDFPPNVAGTIFIPRPGGLELGPPEQFLDQVLRSADVRLIWYRVSELYINAPNNEDNLPGLRVIGYYVTVLANSLPDNTGTWTEVRRDFTPIPSYLYTLLMNKADNPPQGIRTITFKVQATTIEGLLGEPNYITVTNLPIDLGPLGVGPAIDASLTPSEFVAIAFAAEFGLMIDNIPVTEFVDVVVGARRINVFDRTIVFDFVTVEPNARYVMATDYIDIYDHIERIESTGRAIKVVDNPNPTDAVTVARS